MKNRFPLILLNLALLSLFIIFLNWNKSTVDNKENKVQKKEEKEQQVVVEDKESTEEETVSLKDFYNSDKFKMYLIQEQAKLQENFQKLELSTLENKIELLKKEKLQKEQEEVMAVALSKLYSPPLENSSKQDSPIKIEIQIETPEVVESTEEPSIQQHKSFLPSLSFTSLVATVQKAFEKDKEEVIEPKASEDYIQAHKKLMAAASEEKVAETVLNIFDTISSEGLNSLKSKTVKEIELVRKEDSYNRIYDILLNTGDRYLIVSVSIPKESSPYSPTGRSFEVDGRVLDANEEVLSFHVSMEETVEGKRQWSVPEPHSFVPGPWVKILRDLKKTSKN